MAKGLRCKVHRRYRSIKQQLVKDKIETQRNYASNQQLQLLANGHIFSPFKPQVKNAFLSPEDDTAMIPTMEAKKGKVDFRSSVLPTSGFAGERQRRRYTDEERSDLVEMYSHFPVESGRRKPGLSEVKMFDGCEGEMAVKMMGRGRWGEEDNFFSSSEKKLSKVKLEADRRRGCRNKRKERRLLKFV